MDFIKGVGNFLGEAAGTVVGKSVKWVREKTQLKLIEDIGEGAYQATKRTGRLLGQAVSGTVDMATGLIQSDDTKVKEGFSDLGGAASETAKGITKGALGVFDNGKQVVVGLATDDMDKVKNGSLGLAKTVGVGLLAVGVLDIVDGLDGVTETVSLANVDTDVDIAADSALDDGISTENTAFENPNLHHVSPYWRHLKDGQEVWVDGIDDPNVHGTEGWQQHNPDYTSPDHQDANSHLSTFIRISTRNKDIDS